MFQVYILRYIDEVGHESLVDVFSTDEKALAAMNEIFEKWPGTNASTQGSEGYDILIHDVK